MYTNVATDSSSTCAGKMVALASAKPALPALPDIPAIAETIPGFDSRRGSASCSAKTPKEIVARISGKAVRSGPDVRSSSTAVLERFSADTGDDLLRSFRGSEMPTHAANSEPRIVSAIAGISAARQPLGFGRTCERDHLARAHVLVGRSQRCCT